MSSIIPTPEEQSLISSIFALADPQNLGIVTGDAAVKVLSGTNLPTTVLGEIWSSADQENNGFLTRNGVAIAVRLIGYAQKGQSISDSGLLSKPGPLAVIQGISTPSVESSDHPDSSLPPITQQDKSKFLKLFINCGPSNGLLSNDKARDILIKSNLPYEKLSQIWTLADSKVRGALDATDFIIAMYFLQLCMTSSSFTLPSTLPPSLYEQASLTPDSSKSVTSHATGSTFSGSVASPGPVPKQFTGQSVSIPGAVRPQYTGQQPTSVSPGPSVRSAQGDTFLQTKTPSDVIFEQLDTQHKGYIEADVAVPFMLKTGLSSTDLAHIWDLADMNNDGRLTRAGFAVAMRLISSKLAGTENSQNLSHNVTSSPTPSQLRKNTAASDLDLLFDSSSLPATISHATGGGSQWNLQNGKLSANLPVSPVQRLQPQLQQSPIPTSNSALPVSTHTFDLLGDEDDAKAVVPDQSVEIGNLQNQLSSTTRSLEIAQTEKQSAEKIVQQQAEELARLQTQLTTARASYEVETKLLADLRERTLTQQADISKIREELITAEGELSAVKVERNDIQSALLRDKEEVRELQRKLKEVGTETESLKVELEKFKRDARQQKGLLAIAKKQLATAEAEKSKVLKETESTEAEIDAITKEKTITETKMSELAATSSVEDFSIKGSSEDLERIASPVPSVAAAAVPLPSSPAPSSPPVTRQSTNPFDLLILKATSNPTSLGANGSVDITPSTSGFLDFVTPVESGSSFIPTTRADEEVAKASIEETTSNFVEKFPEVETQIPQESVPTLDTSIEEILSPVHEIENDEDNSSSDSEDEKPLSITKEKVSRAANNGTPPYTIESEGINGIHKLESSRENMFDLSEPNIVATPSKSEAAQAQGDSFSSDVDDPFGAPIPPTSPSVLVNDESLFGDKVAFESPSPPAATVKDFDEGFSHIAQPGNEASFNPKFDADFGDFFDFSKITKQESEHHQANSEAVGSWDSALATKPTATEELSGLVPAPASDKLPPVEQQPPITFEDILQLSVSSESTTATTNAQQGTTVSPQNTQNQHDSFAATQQAIENYTNPFPRSSSNEIEHRQTSNSSPTPQRSYSPPIRPSSPPRLPRVSIGVSSKNSPPSTSSPKSKSSGSNLKAPENPSKHKISIRFFGKKDKKDKEDKRGQPKHQGQSLDSQQAIPSFAETGTPAADDDVEAVKQLSAMGFSRSQAIASLEAHGYDVQRALNSLLGA